MDTFFVFWIYGTLVFIVALPHVLLMAPNIKVIVQNALILGVLKSVRIVPK